MLAVAANAEFAWTSLGPYSYQSKRVFPGVYTGGRLTEPEIKLLSQGQFSSVLSVASFPTDDAVYNKVVGDFPSSAREQEIVTAAGLLMIQLDNMSLDTASVDRFNQALLSAKKPVYVHCHVGYSATLYALLFQFEAGALVSAEGTASIYGAGIANGWDYQTNESVVSLVNAVTASSTAATAPSIDLLLADGQSSYQNYFWAHRVGNDLWYNTGQIYDTQIDAIKQAGYASVVSFRVDGESTTHADATDCTSATARCPNNQQFMNTDGTYNVTMERNAVEAAGMKFYNLPVSSASWTPAQLAAWAPALQQAVAAGPALTHCKSGYRSSAFVVAYLAQLGKQCVVWAVQQATEIGYSFDVKASTDVTVMQFFEDTLRC